MDPPTDPVSIFNPYEVLKPQKVNLKENILVDLTPDEEVIKPDAKLDVGSFIDTLTKTDYTLVDLFENIYVTPQHLQKKSIQLEKDKLIDFGDFLDKNEEKNLQNQDVTAESPNTSGITSSGTLIQERVLNVTMQSNSINQLEDITVHINTGKITKSQEMHAAPEKTTLHCEYWPLKNYTHIQPETTKAYRKVDKTDYDYMNYYMTKQIKDHSKVVSQHNLRDCPCSKCELGHMQLSDNMRKNIIDEVKMEHIPIKCKCYCVSSIFNLNKSMDAFFISPFVDDTPVNHSKDLKKSKAINMLLNNQFTIIKSGQLLQTVIKDHKLYAKQKDVNENNENLTKGPDIYEKSIILPQIMERLAARKKVFDDQRNWKRRLVLDSGSL